MMNFIITIIKNKFIILIIYIYIFLINFKTNYIINIIKN